MAVSKLRKSLRNPGKVSFATLVVMVLVAMGSWGLEHTGHGHETWGEMLQPEHVFSFFGMLGSVFGAWLSRSPFQG